MAGQKQEVTDAKVQRVLDAIRRAAEGGGKVTIRSIAQDAGVDHVFIMRRPELRDAIESVGRRGMREEDIRRTVGTSLSDREVDLIGEVLGEAPLAQWLRDAALERLCSELGISPGEIDTARRPARRRRNHQPRPKPEEDSASVNVYKTAERLGDTKISWRNRFSTEELRAAEIVYTALMRIGREVGREEIQQASGQREEQGR